MVGVYHRLYGVNESENGLTVVAMHASAQHLPLTCLYLEMREKMY